MKEIMQVYIFGACFSSCYCIYKKKIISPYYDKRLSESKYQKK